MATNLGPNVSRVLDPKQTGYTLVNWQQGKPPLDSELTLLQQIAGEWDRQIVLRGTPSGWLGNATNAQEVFVTNPVWSNWFKFGQQKSGEKASIEWAVVNGWLIPVTGTLTGTPPGSPNDTDTWNRITLDPPPANSGDARIDFVFLEVWQARIPANPLTTNKPAASAIYRFGNVEGGYSYIADDIQDPAIGFETTQRVQLQYRIRVVSGLVGLASYPDGFDPTVVKARGAASAATSYVFSNMGKELGDPGLWRAGDGTQNALGSVDGYVYAIPLSAVFRRNSVAWDGDPGQNLNGSFNRNPTAVDRTGYKTFSTVPTITSSISASATTMTLSSVSNIALPLTPASAVYIQIGDEILTYTAITGSTLTVGQRGVLGTKPETHASGSQVKLVPIRPDGLFADQITKTDILDLRHNVNPNGFDCDTLLQANLDRLLRGELRANWKRSGGGPQGPFVTYQDKISNSAAVLGVTKLDGPDNIRLAFSDAAIPQPVEVIVQASTGTGASWGLGLTATTVQGTGSQFSPNDVITVPIAQFKNGVSGADADQIRFLSSGDGSGSVKVRVDGMPLNAVLTEGVDYTLSPTNPTPTSDLVITLSSNFRGNGSTSGTATTCNLYITVQVMYGAGRGMSRRPDSIHSVSYLSGGTDIMLQLAGVPSDNTPLRAAAIPLWSKFRNTVFRNQLPVTAESYVDPGSKTVALTPFRRVALPATSRVIDGTGTNPLTTSFLSGTVGSATSTATLVDATKDFVTAGVVPGDNVIFTSPFTGTFFVTAHGGDPTRLILDRNIPYTGGSIAYTIRHVQGLMPLNTLAGAAKWTTTDPLGLFAGRGDPTASTKNLYITLPRHLVPGWGEVRVPIIHSDTTTTPAGGSSTFDEGINFLIMAKKGSVAGRPNSEKDYTSLANGTLSFAAFSTLNFTPATAATYNATFTFGGNTYAGMRFFTDTRGMGRQGLELPPFYGIARLFAVYLASDYQANGSAYDSDTRVPTGGGATNLLRQNFSGATFWIEKDDDGDSTFILNAEAIDLTRAPTPVASFGAGHYVIETSVFGFDRGSFDLTQDFRLVLSRNRTEATSGTRADNFWTGASAAITSPVLVIPGPALSSDEVAINYSRTPYQGDAWGSQTTQTDIGYKPGPLTSGTAYQIASTSLDAANLSRPNPKVLEVLSAVGFSTTLGTGRLSGDAATLTYDIRNIGWEDVGSPGSLNYPPSTGVAARPTIKVGGVATDDKLASIGTEYHGCTERLPLGSLFRDKDFRGGLTAGANDANFRHQALSPLVYMKDRSPGVFAAGVSASKTLDQDEIAVSTSTLASGQPGEVLVHLDGEQGNYGLTTNFRTNRGGSVYVAGGSRPGGELISILDAGGTHPATPGVLNGVAMLVRNAPTSIGSTEVSAGGELMLLVVTTGCWLNAIARSNRLVACGSNGTGEGYAAADLYHLEGRPLVKDNVRITIDPASIALSRGFSIVGV